MTVETMNLINTIANEIEMEKKIKKAKRTAKANAIKARMNEIIAQGVEPEMAKILATCEYDAGLIKAVIY